MKITPKVRKSINKVLQNDFSKNYFNSIPLGEMFKVLEIHGLLAVQEDGSKWDGFLCGQNGRIEIELALEGEVIENSVFILSWYKMESGRYEITSYIS